MLGQLRDRLTGVLDRYIGKPVASWGVDPNTITLVSLPFACIAAFFIAAANWPMAVATAGISIVVDNVDGAVARAAKRATRWGSYLDVMCDKFVEMIIYLGFFLAGYQLLAFLAAALTMLNSYAKPSLALRIPLGNADWPAIGERADRLIILLAGMLATIYYPVLFGVDTISLTLLLVVAVCAIGLVQRMLFAKKLVRSYERTKKKQMMRR